MSHLVYCAVCEGKCSSNLSACPHCGHALSANPSDDIVPTQAAKPARRAQQPMAGVAVSAPVVTPHRTESGHYAGAPVINVALPRRGSSLGVASMVLGVLAFLICWIPIVNLIGAPLAALGLLLGAVGFLVALTRGGSGIGSPIAGAAICGMALFVTITITGAMATGAKAMSERAKEFKQKMQEEQDRIEAEHAQAIERINQEIRAASPTRAGSTRDEPSLPETISAPKQSPPMTIKRSVAAPAAIPEPPPPDRSPFVIWGGVGYSTYHAPGCDRAPKGKDAKSVRRNEAKDHRANPCPRCKPDELPDEKP